MSKQVARGERRDPECRFTREVRFRIRHDGVGQGQGVYLKANMTESQDSKSSRLLEERGTR